MKNLLKAVLESLNTFLESHGFVVSFVEDNLYGAYCANIDSKDYVGTVIYWPDSLFEFHFINCKSGDDAVLETKEISQEQDLELYIKELVAKKLI